MLARYVIIGMKSDHSGYDLFNSWGLPFLPLFIHPFYSFKVYNGLRFLTDGLYVFYLSLQDIMR